MQKKQISIIGAGQEGMAIARDILNKCPPDKIVLVDPDRTKVEAEVFDLEQAAASFPHTEIIHSDNYSKTAGSDLCIITTVAQQIHGESSLNLLWRNVVLFKNIVPELAKYSPDAILLVVSNPVDILTCAAWKFSRFPSNRVIGSGTNLDSSGFRLSIARHFGMNAQDVQAYIIGEHGNNSVVLESSISIGGVPLLRFNPQEMAYVKETLHKKVINRARAVINQKGCSSWGMGDSAADLANSLLGDQRKIHPVVVPVRELLGIDGDVFMSWPARLGRDGAWGVATTIMSLNGEETMRLNSSAETMLRVQRQLGL